MDTMVTSRDSPPRYSQIESQWLHGWQQVVTEYFRLVELPPADQKLLLGAKSATEVVVRVIEAERSRPSKLSPGADNEFITAVASAGTHPDLLMTTNLRKPSILVQNHIAIFLRYTDALDKSLESFGNVCFPAALVFGAVRFMLDVAAKNIKLFIAVNEQLEEFNTRLRRLDVYLALQNPTDAVKWMLARVMMDIVRFCGLATKYLKSITLGKWCLPASRKCISTIDQTQKSDRSCYTGSRTRYHD
jgi:hypothetical protein